MGRKKCGKRKKGKIKKCKRGVLIFPEDGSSLSQDEMNKIRVKFPFNADFKISVKDGKINF